MWICYILASNGWLAFSFYRLLNFLTFSLLAANFNIDIVCHREGVRDRLESNTNADNINTSTSNQTTANNSDLNESSNSSRQGNGTPLLPNDLGSSESNQTDTNWEEDTSQERAWPAEVFTTDERRNLLQATLSQFSERDDNGNRGINGPETTVGDLHQDGTGNSNEPVIVEGQSVWPADNSRQSDGNQPQTRFGGPRTRRVVPMRRLNRLHIPDDDNLNNSIELRELLSRYKDRGSTCFHFLPGI